MSERIERLESRGESQTLIIIQVWHLPRSVGAWSHDSLSLYACGFHQKGKPGISWASSGADTSGGCWGSVRMIPGSWNEVEGAATGEELLMLPTPNSAHSDWEFLGQRKSSSRMWVWNQMFSLST